MIKRSTIVAAIAVLLSVLLHLLGLGVVWRAEQQARPQPSDGDTVTQVVAPGTTFEDLAEPVQEPEEPVEPPEEEPTPDEIPTSDARIASETPQQDTTPDTGTAQPVEPTTAEPPTPDTGQAAEPTTVEPSQETEATDPNLAPPPGTDEVTDIAEGAPDATEAAPDAVPQAPAAPSAPVAPAPSVAVTPSTVPTVSLEPSETETETPVTPTEPAQQPPQETVEAIDSDISDQATAISERPQLPTKRPTPVRQGNFGGSSTTTTTRRAPSQRIESPLSSYSRSGVDIFAQSGSGARSGLSARNTGNATTTNYAGRVLTQLNRAASPPVSGAGWAQVIFVINANGSLNSVDIIDSSGSRSINSAARQQVRNAAPFPPPPGGKRRQLSFSYQIQ